MQVSGAEGNPFRFYSSSSNLLNGFQSNRSGQADIFLIAIVCVGGITRELYPKAAISGRRWRFLLLNGTAGLLFALAVVLTRSRFGMVMVPFALLFQLAFLRPALGMSQRAFAGLVALLLAAGGAALALLATIPKVAESLGRFLTKTELRPEIWKDTLYLIDKYSPWGTGMGTFEPVFQLDERLDWLTFRIVNRAHCDFLELYLEGGVPAAIILSVIVAIVIVAAVKALRKSSAPGRWQVWCAVWGLFLIGAHSVFDYPLRSMSLEAIFAVLVAIILGGARRTVSRSEMEVHV
nr:O-antigen ligase family protein [Novosphingobium sp. SG751A]